MRETAMAHMRECFYKHLFSLVHTSLIRIALPAGKDWKDFAEAVEALKAAPTLQEAAALLQRLDDWLRSVLDALSPPRLDQVTRWMASIVHLCVALLPPTMEDVHLMCHIWTETADAEKNPCPHLPLHATPTP